MPYKVKLTDSITLKKFVILKPEVELEFSDKVHIDDAYTEAQQMLDYMVNRQLSTIVDRMDLNDKRSVIADASADPRFVKLIRESTKS